MFSIEEGHPIRGASWCTGQLKRGQRFVISNWEDDK
jgi:hypothetical protein